MERHVFDQWFRSTDLVNIKLEQYVDYNILILNGKEEAL